MLQAAIQAETAKALKQAIVEGIGFMGGQDILLPARLCQFRETLHPVLPPRPGGQ
jgi:hypothetical protein